MAKRTQNVEKPTEELLEVEVIGSVKFNGEYVTPGEAISLPLREADRLIDGGHVRSLRPRATKNDVGTVVATHHPDDEVTSG